jgi:flagellar biosynthesis/type III secretory pathway protein FliH
MTYEEITTAAETFMSHPGFDILDLLYRDGMREGFKDGAWWAQEQLNEQVETLKADIKKLLQQVEKLQAEVEKLKSPK